MFRPGGIKNLMNHKWRGISIGLERAASCSFEVWRPGLGEHEAVGTAHAIQACGATGRFLQGFNVGSLDLSSRNALRDLKRLRKTHEEPLPGEEQARPRELLRAKGGRAKVRDLERARVVKPNRSTVH